MVAALGSKRRQRCSRKLKFGRTGAHEDGIHMLSNKRKSNGKKEKRTDGPLQV